jgi:hypothetical protein
MEDAYILCNIIENVLIKENNQYRKKKPLWFFGAPNGISTI